MATFSNIPNNFTSFDNLLFKSKISKIEDSKNDSYTHNTHNTHNTNNKHIKFSIPSILINKDSNIFPKQTGKSQLEEFQKLSSEIASLESSIKELEVSKSIKIAKVEDLRHIIQRIADEDCFDCVFSKQSNRICSISNSKDKPKRISNFNNNNNSVGVPMVGSSMQELHHLDTTTSLGETEEEGEPQGKADNRTDFKCSCRRDCSGYVYYQCYQCLQDRCLLFWQENLGKPKAIFKA